MYATTSSAIHGSCQYETQSRLHDNLRKMSLTHSGRIQDTQSEGCKGLHRIVDLLKVLNMMACKK